MTLVLIFCIKGFLNFRSLCQERGYYVISMDSLVWSLVGFVGIFVQLFIYRQSNTPGSISWRAGLNRASTASTKDRKEFTRLDSSWSFPSTLSSTPSLLYLPTSSSETIIGFPAWREDVVHVHKSTNNTPAGQSTQHKGLRCILWFNWESTFSHFSKWLFWKEKQKGNSMNMYYTTQ